MRRLSTTTLARLAGSSHRPCATPTKIGSACPKERAAEWVRRGFAATAAGGDGSSREAREARRRCYTAALAWDPTSVAAWANISVTLDDGETVSVALGGAPSGNTGRVETFSAAQCAAKALELGPAPGTAVLWTNLALGLPESDVATDASAAASSDVVSVRGVPQTRRGCALTALSLDPGYSDAWLVLARALQKEDRQSGNDGGAVVCVGSALHTAHACFLNAVEADAANAGAWRALGASLQSGETVDVNAAGVAGCFSRAACEARADALDAGLPIACAAPAAPTPPPPPSLSGPSLRRGDYRRLVAIAPRWGDHSPDGHATAAAHTAYFETAVQSCLAEALDAGGAVLAVVAESGCRFFQPLSFRDQAVVALRVAADGQPGVRFELALFRGDDAAPRATAHLVYVFVERTSRRPVSRLPDALRAAIEALRVAPH